MFSAKATSGKDRDASLAPGGPSLPKCRMVSKAVSLLINRAQEDTLPPNAATMAAALELLHALCSSQWLCLNLLFSACLEDTTGEDDQVPVTVSGAFKLAQCSQRLVKELLSRCRDWQVAEKGSEDETLAQEDLASWLQVTELLAELCRVVVRHCPTASAFLNVVMPGIGAPGVLADIQQVLNPLAAGQIKQGANTLAEQAAAIVRAISTLQSELQAKPEGPPPATLLAKDLMSPQRRKKNGVSNGSTPSAMPEADTPSDQSEADVVAEVVTLLDAASDLEANPEWSAVAELDAAEPPANMDWEFDAGTLRKKRQAFLEKSDADRKAKRLKTQQMQVQQRADAAAAAARRRDAPVAGPPPAAAPRQADAGAPVKEEAAAAPVKEEAAPPATATKQEAPAPAPVPVKAAGINPAEADIAV
ncbi:unnamed protein product [Polarella glacialis]|uniref:Uncharacterized protein n=1 Tax=Polarella glacialis TaxID=89957 RepID=A0A813HZC7_POLGL|nr:unnamed protein product [Polarella glacialis]